MSFLNRFRTPYLERVHERSLGVFFAFKIGFYVFSLVLCLVLILTTYDKAMWNKETCLLWSITALKPGQNISAPVSRDLLTNGTFPRGALSRSNNSVVEVVLETGLIYQTAGQWWTCGVTIYTGVVGLIITVLLFLGTLWFSLRERFKARSFLTVALTVNILYCVLVLFTANVVSGGIYTTCLTLGVGTTDPTQLQSGCQSVWPTNLITVLTGAVASWALFLIWLLHSVWEYIELRIVNRRIRESLSLETPGTVVVVAKPDSAVEVPAAASHSAHASSSHAASAASAASPASPASPTGSAAPEVKSPVHEPAHPAAAPASPTSVTSVPVVVKGPASTAAKK